MSNKQPEQVAACYDRQANDYTKAAERPMARIRLETIRQALIHISTDVRITGQIFDLGCGTGQSTEIIRQVFPTAAITGIDCSAAEIEISISRAKKSDLNIDYFVDDLFKRTFEPHGVNLFVAIMSIHYFQDPKQLRDLLARLAAALTNEGRLVIQIPNPDLPLPYRDYGVEHSWPIDCQDANSEGSPYDVRLYPRPYRGIESDWGRPLVGFTNYRHSSDTFANAFAATGFLVRQQPLVIPADLTADSRGIDWSELLAQPLYRTLIARKCVGSQA